MATDLALIGGSLPRLIVAVGRPAVERFLDLFHRPHPERQCAPTRCRPFLFLLRASRVDDETRKPTTIVVSSKE